MLVVVDIGNTNIVVGVYESGMLHRRFRVSTNPRGTPDEYGSLMMQILERGGVLREKIEAVAIASVVPQLDGVFDEVCASYLHARAWSVGRNLHVNMPVLVDNPKEVGADRIVNAYAAWQQFKQAMILVDFGTATTLDVVSNQGEYLGGAIAPGIEIASDALFRSAAKLNRVELAAPQHAIGRNTKEAIQSGLYLGYIGLIDTLVGRMQSELGYAARVLATGGLARFFQGSSQSIQEVDPDLTLRGLKDIYLENERESGR